MPPKKAVRKEASPAPPKQAEPVVLSAKKESYNLLNAIVTVLAFATRFWRIYNPDEVVFDEVHFGKFASHYLQREYYFDLHPPLAKLMFAGVGYLLGYDGTFKFDSIGDSYPLNNVPYMAYRALPALLGSLTCTGVFLTMQTCGFTPIACFLGASMVIFDSAQATQSRLILLDATLIFFMVGALLSYVRFMRERKAPFGLKWWLYLASTGFFLSCVMSTKYVGLFTYLTVGAGVIGDLWSLMDARGKKHPVPLKVVTKHFFARLYALVIGPFLLYLFWFYVHFHILSYSGPGNSHMSPEFQATLKANPMVREALDVHFFDTVSIRGLNTEIFLHSHPHQYPLQYPDGRISSRGQQVTGYGAKDDPYNFWQILPTVPFTEEEMAQGGGPIVGSQQVMLRHVSTNSYLLTHDVASPGYPTNEEFTTVSQEAAYGKDHEDTLFLLEIVSANPEDFVRSKMTQFRLKHVHTGVSMWLADKKLPDWGYDQVEINGNKRTDAPGTVWTFDQVHNIVSDEQRAKRQTMTTSDTLPRRSFLTDWWELQLTMFRSNNQLTTTHPYMSGPLEWPLMKRGISYWSSKAEGDQRQIYLVGNHAIWYLINLAVFVFIAVYVLDQLTGLREYQLFTGFAKHKLENTILWVFLGYLFHYAPFYLMGRQLFLHHYLPAQVLGCMLVGALADLLCGQLDAPKQLTKRTMMIAVSVILTVSVVGFVFWSPLVYGLHLTGDGVRSRQWFNIELQFNKK